MLKQLPDHDWIQRHIPHQGRMCLLDKVLDWDLQQICCQANSHRHSDNPLRAHDRLGSLCGIEYAAQAIAVHAALLSDQQTAPRAGVLASVRAVELFSSRLDTLEAPLEIHAQRLNGDQQLVMYGFAIHSARIPQLQGRLMLLLDRPQP